MLVVLGFVIPPGVFGAFRGYTPIPFALRAVGTMMQCGATLGLVLFLLWRNGETRRSIGWRFRWVDLVLGFVLFPALLLAMVVWRVGLGNLGFSMLPNWVLVRPTGLAQIALCIAAVAMVGLSEESLYRGFLMKRLRGLGASSFGALVIAALCFGPQHAYQGTMGIGVSAMLAFCFGAVYLWRKNLTAPIVMHALWNLMAYGVIPVQALLRRLWFS